MLDQESKPAVFGRVGHPGGNFNIFDYFVSGGITLRGMPQSRPHDELALAIAWAMTSDRVDDLANRLGIGVEPSEGIIEPTCRAPIGDRVVQQPSLHYVVNPGIDPALGNALVAGLRINLSILN